MKRDIVRYWALAALLVAAMFVSLALISNFRYENSDDIAMVKAFMGFEGGQPADFSLYIHTLLAWTLCGFNLLAPKIAWFSVYQLALLFFSSLVIAKGLLQLSARARRPIWSGVLVSVLYLTVFAAFACCRVNFTTTASLAGAAALMQFLTVDFHTASRKTRRRALLPALLLLVGGYCLRAYAVLPSVFFLCILFLWRFIPEKDKAKQNPVSRQALLKSALLIAVILVALFGFRQAELELRGLRSYMNWNDASGVLLDYSDFEKDASPAVNASSGLSASEIKLVQQWYFMSSDINEPALLKMASAYQQAKPDGWTGLKDFFAKDERNLFLMAIPVLLCGLCLLKDESWKRTTSLLAVASVTAALLLTIYLAFQGRLLARAADSVLMPCMALELGFVLSGRRSADSRGFKRAGILLLSVLVAISALGNLRLVEREITRTQDSISLQRESDLEAYALLNPDLLVVRTPNLLRDTRLFPDVSGGTPKNLMIWGDWLCRTPSWNRQLVLSGFDAEHFTAGDWLKDGIVFAALSQADTQDLCAYLTEATGKTIEAEEQGAYGTLEFYSFRAV